MTPPLPASASRLGEGTRGDRIECTDLLSLCASLDDQSVDMILADLPYGTTACSWDEIIPFAPMWAAFKRVIKPRGAIALTASQPFTSKLVMSNLDWLREELIWVKQHPKGFLDARRKHMDAHETVLVFCDGEPTYNPQGTVAVNIMNGRKNKSGNGVYGKVGNPEYVQTVGNFPRSVLYFDAITQNNQHPTQKPVDLFRYLIRTYTQPGDIVLDPVVGSGTTALAARAEGRHYIVGDISPDYIAITRDRLRLPFEPRAVQAANDTSDLPLFAVLTPDTRTGDTP